MKIYYVGCGSFGYAVFYDEENENIRVSRIYNTFQEALNEMSKMQRQQEKLFITN